jgi:hypothetical protein
MKREALSKVVIQALREYCERHSIPEPIEEEPKLPEQSKLWDNMWRV